MELKWGHRRCILCPPEQSADGPFDRAHLIPESVGGFVWARTMCKACNSWAGHKVEAGIVSDDSIDMAVEALENELPKLARKFAERRRYFARTRHGTVGARWKSGVFEAVPSKLDDGSVFLPPPDARRAVETAVRRRGGGDDKVAGALERFAAALERFAAAPVDATVLFGDHTITHREIGGFNPALNGSDVPETFPSLVAFHFLALASGAQIYDPQLDGLRESIRGGESRSTWHLVERGIERAYRPEHVVGFSQTEPHLIVRVQLFAWNVWRVHFPGIASTSTPHGIMLDLKTREIRAARPNRPTRIDRRVDLAASGG